MLGIEVAMSNPFRHNKDNLSKKEGTNKKQPFQLHIKISKH